MWYASKGLKIDNVHKPLGGRIEEVPTPGSRYRRLDNSTYMSEESIAVCTNCTREKCSGRCEKIIQIEKRNVDPRKRSTGKRNGYKVQRNLTFRGKKYSSGELAQMAGISVPALKDRLKRGWTMEEAVTTPRGCKRPGKE